MDLEVSGTGTDYIKQNLMAIRNDIMQNVNMNYPSELKNDPTFSNFLSSAISNVTDDMSGAAFDKPAFMDTSSNTSHFSDAFNTFNSSINQSSATVNPIANKSAIDNYSSVKNLTSDKNSPIYNYLNNPNTKGVNGEVISDQQFYNAEALTADQIDKILTEKGSPFANRTYSNNRTVGQLIYDLCHKAGTSNEGGSHTINPSLILSIMGAESSFGKDPQNVAENPFNIRIGGSFDKVGNFEDSLKIAINTMYNWSQARPQDSQVSLFDFSGDKYCEDYTKVWKPNVEKFYQEFSA